MKLPIAHCRLPIGNARRAGAIVGAALVALAVAGCERQSQQAAAPARPPAPVVVAKVQTDNVPIYLDEVGRTVAQESVTIQPQVSGKIIDVHFTDGADVKKGQLLFTIDPRPFKAAVAEAEAELAENRATLKFSQDEVKRLESVKGSGAVSQQEYEKNVNAAAVAAAKVEAAQAKLDTAKLNLEYATIESPIDGRAGERLVDPGNVVQGGGMQGGTQLLVIQRFDPIYADFTVTENVLGTVRKFMADGVLATEDPMNKLKVEVDVPGDARQVIDALSGSKPTTAPATQQAAPLLGRNVIAGTASGARTGPLTFLDNRVQEGSGTVKLRATIPNSDRYFWPGQFVRVRLVLTTKQNAALIPERAQQIGQQGPYVYVVKPDMTAEIRNIKPGQRQKDGMIVVNDGLAAGEQVIVEGHMAVTPGGKVAILPPPPAAPGQAAPAQATAGGATSKPAAAETSVAAEGAHGS